MINWSKWQVLSLTVSTWMRKAPSCSDYPFKHVHFLMFEYVKMFISLLQFFTLQYICCCNSTEMLIAFIIPFFFLLIRFKQYQVKQCQWNKTSHISEIETLKEKSMSCGGCNADAFGLNNTVIIRKVRGVIDFRFDPLLLVHASLFGTG